jgi:hypothetical protein
VYPVYVLADDPVARRVLVSPGRMVGPLDEQDPVRLDDTVISDGLSLCSIHHRAFDQNPVGVSPDHTVHVSRRLLDEEDGPMRRLLKQSIEVPRRRVWHPDRERLSERFERFRPAAG